MASAGSVGCLALAHAADTLGLGRWWKAQPIVQRNPWLI
jgi:hypothetical protein